MCEKRHEFAESASSKSIYLSIYSYCITPRGDYVQVRVCALLVEGMLLNKVPVKSVNGSEVKDDRVKMLNVKFFQISRFIA